MQLKFKIEMLLSETRAFRGGLKVVYCILHCLSVHLSQVVLVIPDYQVAVSFSIPFLK